MANRIETAVVSGETIKLSSNDAGAAGSFNAVSLAFTFDTAWDGTTKTVQFLDTYGANPVNITLTTNLLVDGAYIVPIPAEPLVYAGEINVTVRGVDFATDGTTAERIIMSASTTMKVKNNLYEVGGATPVEPTPTQTEQLQAEIDSILADIVAAAQAAGSATAAAASALAAQTAETNAELAESNAELAETNAKTSETNAGTYATNASNSALSASGSATTAVNAKNDAQTAKAAAELAETHAETAESNAKTSETNAGLSAIAAAGSATDANNAKVAAQTAQTNAELAETHAETAETNAETAETGAVAAKNASESARDISVTAKDNALLAKTAAELAETHAETAQTAAELAETHAETAETNAGTYATNASNSATAAAGSATDANTAKLAAQTAQTAAELAETHAETAETNAETAETNAAAKATLSQSYAVGGTASRAGEDTDNAKYYKEQAAAIVGGDYPTKTEAQGYVSTHDASGTAHSTLFGGKVDKVTGKGLSTEDYTTTEKSKLSGIEASANNYTHPASHAISVITGLQTALDGKVDDGQVLTDVPAGALFTDTVYTHPTTAGNKHIPSGGASNQVLKYSADGTAVWGTDADTITTINGNTGAIVKADITALGIPAQDTVYTHPSTHSADIIVDGTTNKVYTATEQTKLAGIATGANVGVVPNAVITGATKTKITYDAKGLVTSGADATTADITDSTDKRYCTDAQKTVIGNTSGTNTGDETTSTIKTKLGISTLSGSNTGDQTLSGLGGLPIAGGTMTGALVAQTNTNYTTKQMRNVIMSTSDAVLDSMADGDIWIKYV